MRTKMPPLKMPSSKAKLMCEPPAAALEKFKPGIRAVSTENQNPTFNIYSEIGISWWDGSGVSAQMIADFLTENAGKDVNININSPGGDFFEGTAIYNLLREHDAAINVRVIGLAASAASIIAMAGDNIQIAESGFMMIHNSWLMTMGNRHDLSDTAVLLGQFDASMQGVYAKRSGLDAAAVAEIMDAETWLGGSAAVEEGFADSLLESDEVEVDNSAKSEYTPALRKVDNALARQGVPRSERRILLKELRGTQNAVADNDPTPGAGNDHFSNALEGLLLTITK